MNIRQPLILGVSVAALLAGAALPASADSTTATFVLTAGSLTLTVAPAAPVPLTAGPTGTTDISGSLGNVSVIDNRGGTAVWAVTAGSTAFVGALATAPSSSTAVQYTGGPVTEGGAGSITVADGTIKTITGATSAVGVILPTAVSGNNSASWVPTLDVTMPASSKADIYSGTVTTSVS